MDIVLGTIVLAVAGIGVIGLFVLGSLHIIRCTESKQERFSLASVRRSIALARKWIGGLL